MKTNGRCKGAGEGGRPMAFLPFALSKDAAGKRGRDA
jgi:hypothetical protein